MYIRIFVYEVVYEMQKEREEEEEEEEGKKQKQRKSLFKYLYKYHILLISELLYIVEIRRKFDVWYYYPWQMDTDKIRKSTV